MKKLKKKLRELFPTFYDTLWKIFKNERWGNYYDGIDPDLRIPEKCLMTLPIPHYVNSFLNVGCGSGRDFLPFNGSKKLIGIDIVPEKRIRWVQEFKNLTYYHIKLEAYTRKLEKEKPDMSKWLVYSSVTLMYVSQKEQERFYAICKQNGCKNYIFQEYAPNDSPYRENYFKLNENLFSQRRFKGPFGSKHPVTYYSLES